MSEPDHHNDASRVIAVLDTERTQLAHELLDAGFAVVDAWGPVQMAVANLLLERDGTQVLFDTERGTTAVLLIRDGRRSGLGAAIAAWAGSPGPDGRPHAVDLVPWALISTFSRDMRVHGREGLAQLATYGSTVCEWFVDADPGAIDAVEAETRALVDRLRRHAGNRSAVTPELLTRRYRLALDRYFGRSSPDNG